MKAHKVLLQELLSISASQNLFEAKSVRDFRHENIEDKFSFFGASKTSGWISPTAGFHFTYHRGELILSSTENDTYSGLVAKDLWAEANQKRKLGRGIPRELLMKLRTAGETDLWNQLGGVVVFADKTITFAKEDAQGKNRVRAINNVKEFQSALKNLRKYGVTVDFKIKGLSAPYNSMTVGTALAQTDPVAELIKSRDQVMYHGTSLKRWEESISTQGLRPGNTGEVYIDLIPGYSDRNVYLATNAKTAEFYGKRQAKKDNDSGYVILQVTVPDSGKILPDDAFANNLTSGSEFRQSKVSVRELGSLAYKGMIRPKFITLLSKRKA